MKAVLTQNAQQIGATQVPCYATFVLNLQAALGPAGPEGGFRQAASATLGTLRGQADTLTVRFPAVALLNSFCTLLLLGQACCSSPAESQKVLEAYWRQLTSDGHFATSKPSVSNSIMHHLVQALLAAVVGDPLVPWAAEGREGGAARKVDLPY